MGPFRNPAGRLSLLLIAIACLAYRGGLGIEMEVKGLVEGSWTLEDSGRHRFPPWGIHGGKPGMASDSLLRLPGESGFQHVEVIRHPVPAGAEAIVATAGGGGWGDPLEREMDRVRWDVIEGYVSVEAARHSYGVVFQQGTVEVDVAASKRLRAEMANTRSHKES